MAQILKSMSRHFTRNNAVCKLQWTSYRHSVTMTEIDQIKTLESSSLKTVANAEETFEMIQKQAHKLTHKQLLLALKSLFDLHKAGRLEFKEGIMNNPSFQILCHSFKKQAPALEASEAVQALKFLTHFKIPADSLIVQSMLQIIRCKINDLNLLEIIFIDFLFSKMDSQNHLVDALRLALPLVFQIHLPLEQDNDDVPLLRKSLNFSCANQMPDKFINNIVTGLILNDQGIDMVTAKSVIWSLCQVDCSSHPTRAQLLHICFDILKNNIHEVTCDDVIKTANILKSRIIDKDLVYYSENLMDSMANKFVDDDVDFERSINIARILSRIGHTHLKLLDHLCIKAASTPDTLSTCSIHILFAFINCLAFSNHTPERHIWEDLKRQISLNPLLDNDTTTFPWIRMCLELVCLDIYEDRILKKIYSEDFLDEYLERYNKELDYVSLLTINEAVKAFCEQKYSLPDRVLLKAKDVFPLHRVTGVIAEHLAKGLGHPELVVKNVLLPSHMIADVMVCIKDGCPVKIYEKATDNIPLEHLNIPEGSSVICIINFGPSCFSVNSNRLRGTFRLTQDILEKQGYIVVGLNREKWLKALPHERTPYLIREINYQCAKRGISFNPT